ncbi:MAG TPA: alkaline phosphatase family protein [Opitutaceae bacterium]|jgi:hypothetical protein
MTSALKKLSAILAAMVALAEISALRAQSLSFDVNIDTSGLSAEGGDAPFYLDLAMIYGNGSLAANTATLSNFSFFGGGALGSATVTGGATGSLSSAVILPVSKTDPLADLFQEFSLGVTSISFVATITETGPDVGTPTEFTAAILDSSLGGPAQLFTTAPDTASLVTLALDSANTVGDVKAYSAVSSADGNIQLSGVSASVPDTSSTAALLGAVLLGAALLFRYRGLFGRRLLGATAALAFAFGFAAAARATSPGQVTTVWYILLENRDFTNNETSGGAEIWGNPAAPYLNSLVTPGNPNAAQVSYCAAYHNALAVYNGSGPSIHPSEPNYVWMEAGSNLSKLDDSDPYGSGQSVAQIQNFLAANPSYSGQNLSGLLQAAGISWRAYSEETNQLNTGGTNANLGGTVTATPAPSSIWTVPLASFSGKNTAFVNPYNGSNQWNFACKHTGSLFFADTNGTASLTIANTSTYPGNAETLDYVPLPNLASDLANGTCAQYNVITPDQFNDMHTALTGGFTYDSVHYTGDSSQIAQGDNFLSIVVPQIMASSQYKDGGCIIIWTDETEGSQQNDFRHTLTEIVLSPLAKGNAYCSTLNYTHSSDLNTMQKIFQTAANTDTGYLNDAANPSNPTPADLVGTVSGLTATSALVGQSAIPPSGYGAGQAYDLSDLFEPGVIPSSIPAVSLVQSGFTLNRRTHQYTQTATLTNMLSGSTANPAYIEVSSLPSGAVLVNAAGIAPDGSAYVFGAPAGLASGQSNTVTLVFTATGSISDVLSLTTNGTP